MFLFYLSLIALVGVNVWHLLLLLTNPQAPRPDSISEHAYSTRKRLQIHRILHSGFSAVLITYALFNLVPLNQYLLASLLIVGAIMDVIEVFTLRVGEPAHPISLNTHQITAWIMAFCYLTYGVFVARYAGLSGYIVHGLWMLFFTTLAIASLYKFKRFWISQMFYFTVLAGAIAFAHFKLI